MYAESFDKSISCFDIDLDDLDYVCNLSGGLEVQNPAAEYIKFYVCQKL